MQLITYFLCCSYFVSSLCSLKMKYHLRLNLDKTEEQQSSKFYKISAILTKVKMHCTLAYSILLLLTKNQ